MPPLHPLLKRQLKRLGLEVESGAPDAERWRELVQRVSRAYEEHDQERYLLERSQDLASQEMAALYATVRADRDLLDSRVRERTEALALSEGRLSSLLSLSADWIWEQDAELRFSYFSDGIEAATGIAPGWLIGKQRMSSDAFDAPAEAIVAYEACVDGRKAFRDFTYGFTRPDGVRRFIRISGEPVFDDSGSFSGYRGVGRDVTQSTVAEQKVHELARFDSLTGLPNRNMFLGELDRTIARARRHATAFAVFFIDLDRFKNINDTLGHDAGDELLKTMAARLRGAVRESDLVARLGGDEFVVLLEGEADAADLSTIAHKLLAGIGEPITIQGCSFLVTGSIGIGLYPGDGEDAAELLKHADAAMYLAKDKGKNNVQFYTSDLAELAARQFEVESALRFALTRGELLLHFQPKIDIASGRMLGVEALVRWNHPKRGLVPPGDFIPLAEDTGLIVPLSEWALREAAKQARVWQQAFGFAESIAVNLPSRLFERSDLVEHIHQCVTAVSVPHRMIQLEITEDNLMKDLQNVIPSLHRLNEIGVEISIDDFGTGYSSLAYLTTLPISELKVDRSFVRDLGVTPQSSAVVTAIIALARSLGLRVVAEGVETLRQMEVLHRLGCGVMQGFLFSRAVPADDLQRWLESTVLPRKAPWIGRASGSDPGTDAHRAAGGRQYR